jgi:hypothetical protein
MDGSLFRSAEDPGTCGLFEVDLLPYSGLLSAGTSPVVSGSALAVWLTTCLLLFAVYPQKRFSLFGKTIDLIMIARRSRHYAGTRYLKRGINVHGKAANDCEIEQVVQRDDGYRSQFCSYLQMRGSIPTYWYQETSVTMPKPPILINRTDPDYQATEVGKDVTLSPSIGLLLPRPATTYPPSTDNCCSTTYPIHSSGTYSRLVSQIQLAHNRTGFGEATGEEAPRVSSRL